MYFSVHSKALAVSSRMSILDFAIKPAPQTKQCSATTARLKFATTDDHAASSALGVKSSHPPEWPTGRELEVLHFICAGNTTKEIAARLTISAKTAACHRFRLMQKAGARNSVELFRWAFHHDLVSMEEKQCH